MLSKFKEWYNKFCNELERVMVFVSIILGLIIWGFVFIHGEFSFLTRLPTHLVHFMLGFFLILNGLGLVAGRKMDDLEEKNKRLKEKLIKEGFEDAEEM